MKDEISAGGLRCSQVLAALDAFADGTLSDELTNQARAHLCHCARCEQFGARYLRLIQELKGSAQERAVSEQLLERILSQ